MAIPVDMLMDLVRFLLSMTPRRFVLSLYRSCLGSTVFEVHWCSFPVIELTILPQKSLSSGSYNHFVPSSMLFLDLRCRDCMAYILIGVECPHSVVHILTRFGFLLWSLMPKEASLTIGESYSHLWE